MLLRTGREAGVVSNERWARFQRTQTGIRDAIELMQTYFLTPHVSSLHPCNSGWSHMIAELEEGRVRCQGRWRPAEVRPAVAEVGVKSHSLRSAYQMLHNPNIKVTQLIGAVPQLDAIDPQILERAGIEGTLRKVAIPLT